MWPEGGGEDDPHRSDNLETESSIDNRSDLGKLGNTRDAANRTCQSCGRLFKNERGVKIHQGKTKCHDLNKQRKIEFSSTCKTQEDFNQETNHSVQDLQAISELDTQQHEVTAEIGFILERKPRLKWPASTDKRWQQLDKDLDMVLNNTLKGSNSRKVEKMTQIVYDTCSELFGEDSKSTSGKTKAGPSRRQSEIANLRKNLRDLTKHWKKAEELERPGLRQLRKELRSRLIILRRAEKLKNKQREKKKARESFFSNPFRFVSDLLGKPKSGRLESKQSEVEESIKNGHSDPLKAEPLGECPLSLHPVEQKVPFREGDIKLEEVKEIVMRARSASAPGPSGITYRVYKYCPRLLRRLWRLIRGIWKSKTIPNSWTLAEGCFVPKERNAKSLDQFREISLLDVEGKIFWAVVAKRLTLYLLENKFVDTSVQKGGVSGYSGCLEHTAAMTQLIREAKTGKKNLSVVWLDLAKAYPSIPHQLIEKSLRHYQVPEEIVGLVGYYLDNLKMRFSIGNFTTKWQSRD